MAALSARRLVWSAMSLITLTMRPMASACPARVSMSLLSPAASSWTRSMAPTERRTMSAPSAAVLRVSSAALAASSALRATSMTVEFICSMAVAVSSVRWRWLSPACVTSRTWPERASEARDSPSTASSMLAAASSMPWRLACSASRRACSACWVATRARSVSSRLTWASSLDSLTLALRLPTMSCMCRWSMPISPENEEVMLASRSPWATVLK